MDQNQMMLQYLMEMGALQPEAEEVQRQRALVQQLRQGGQMPGMRQVGRVAVAANPLEFLNSVGNTGLAEFRNQSANQAADAYGQRRRDVLQSLRTRMMPSGNPSFQDPNNAGAAY